MMMILYACNAHDLMRIPIYFVVKGFKIRVDIQTNGDDTACFAYDPRRISILVSKRLLKLGVVHKINVFFLHFNFTIFLARVDKCLESYSHAPGVCVCMHILFMWIFFFKPGN